MWKKKIIIIGGLGYIGTELCKIYSGESRFNEIIVIDKNFVSERVHQLKDWNIKFFQGDILDYNFLKKILDGTNIIHHLAGITDVAYTKSESTNEQDKNIRINNPLNIKTIFLWYSAPTIWHQHVRSCHFFKNTQFFF